MPRRALRGHAPLLHRHRPLLRPLVSVPRRALRGHAPSKIRLTIVLPTSGFSAPKGVERACPPDFSAVMAEISAMFQCPEGR
mgnify:CR=1 FL=1